MQLEDRKHGRGGARGRRERGSEVRVSEVPTLQGERVRLRPFVEEDVEPMTLVVTAPEIAEWWRHYDAAKVRGEFVEDPAATAFAIEHDGAFIGAIAYYEETDPDYLHATVDVTIDAAYVGRGLGTDALRTLARYLFEQRGHHRITVDPAVANARAIRAYEKVGFRPVGTMRRYERVDDDVWRDGLLMDLLAEELT